MKRKPHMYFMPFYVFSVIQHHTYHNREQLHSFCWSNKNYYQIKTSASHIQLTQWPHYRLTKKQKRPSLHKQPLVYISKIKREKYNVSRIMLKLWNLSLTALTCIRRIKCALVEFGKFVRQLIKTDYLMRFQREKRLTKQVVLSLSIQWAQTIVTTFRS